MLTKLIADRNKYGSWVKHETKHVLLGNNLVYLNIYYKEIIYYCFMYLKVSWNENWKNCCSLGLQPLSLTYGIVKFLQILKKCKTYLKTFAFYYEIV